MAAKSGINVDRQKEPDVSAQNASLATGSTTVYRQDFDWYRHADDEDAEKIMRNFVPPNIRYSAVALAHQRHMAGVEGAKLWDKLRWTKRLRLCEEINGGSF